MKKGIYITILLAVSILFFITACKREAEPNIIQIATGDFYFKPATIELKAGQEVKIELVNEGNIEHEFMVGRGVKAEDSHVHGEMHEGMEENTETSEMGHEHNGEMHQPEGMQDMQGMNNAHAGMSRGFDQDFFEGINVAAETENGAEFMRMPGHGTMVLLKPHGKAIITFNVPTDRIGEWEMACFIPGHYEAMMRGKIIVK